MKLAEFTVEMHYRVYNENSGDFVTIRPDCDGLGLLEVDGGQDYGRIVIPLGMADMLAGCIIDIAKDMNHVKKCKDSENA